MTVPEFDPLLLEIDPAYKAARVALTDVERFIEGFDKSTKTR